jgi:S1-C subfamily serine protease
MENTNRVRTGSGSLIDAQKRLVLTNFHVVGEKADAIVMFPIFDNKGNLVPEREKYFDMLKSNGGIPAKVLFTDRSKDLAILQLASIPKGAPALRLAKESPGPGDKIHSIGSPGVSGALFAYTDGSVKAVYQKKMRSGSGPNDPNSFLVDAKIIETSSATNKGDSGGPLMNDKCELIGVTQGMLVGGEDTRTISYFVDISEVKALLKSHKLTVTGPPGSAAASDTGKPDKPPTATGTSGTVSAPPDKEKAARAALNGAGLFAGKNDKLKEIYQEVIEKYPGTKAADEAKALLEKLK